MSFTDTNLIAAVRSQPCIYDFTSSHYRDRMRKSSAWEEIGIQLSCNIFDCQKRWKSLRDRFVKEIRTAKQMNAPPGNRKEWYLYKSMEFLLPYIHNPVKGSIFGMEELDVSDDVDVKDSPCESPNSDSSEPQSRKRRKKDNLETLIIENLQRRTELEDDEDRLFLLSLVPSLKRLCTKTRIETKIKIQQLLLEAEFDDSSSHLKIPT